jgi:hypothetical protein
MHFGSTLQPSGAIGSYIDKQHLNVLIVMQATRSAPLTPDFYKILLIFFYLAKN